MPKKSSSANNKTSVAERIIKVMSKQPKIAEEIRREIKDKFGYPIKIEDIRVNLLYLLRRQQIMRKKDGTKYKYFA
jgi:hypothetical protein